MIFNIILIFGMFAFFCMYAAKYINNNNEIFLQVLYLVEQRKGSISDELANIKKNYTYEHALFLMDVGIFIMYSLFFMLMLIAMTILHVQGMIFVVAAIQAGVIFWYLSKNTKKKMLLETNKLFGKGEK